MVDVVHANLILDRVLEYASWAWQERQWTELMDGRTTMVPAS